MGYEQQYEELLELCPQIDEKLKELNFEKIKELFIWLAKSASYQKLKQKENQLIMLDVFCQIWLEEKKRLETVGISEDIFFGVDSLKTLEKKYLTIQFGALRLETAMPVEYYQQAVDEIIDYRVSGIALHTIIMRETAERAENIVKLGRLLKQKGQTVTALFLLQKGNESYPQDQEILLELADCWLEGEQYNQAYECLQKIQKPDENVLELLRMLEKAVADETIQS